MKKQSKESKLVGGVQVQQSWLKPRFNQGLESYRTWLHFSFQKAECEYKLRKLEENGGDGRANGNDASQYKDKIEQLTNSLVDSQLSQFKTEYQNEVPKIPDFTEDKRKLSKISRNCFKKPLQRFFEIDTGKQQMVQYAKQEQVKPSKVLSLLQCKVSIEFINDIREPEERKLWAVEESQYRVGIRLADREFQPVHYYCGSKHEAINIKFFIEMLLNEQADIISKYVLCISDLYKVRVINQVFDKVLELHRRIFQVNKLHTCLFVIQQDFQKIQVDSIDIWDQILDNAAALEGESSPVKISSPKIWSTFKCGLCECLGNKDTTSKIIRSRLLRFKKRRNNMRDQMVSDMIRSKVKQHTFNTPFKYSVHSQVIENIVKFIINILGFHWEYNDFLIPLGEVCFIATDFDPNHQRFISANQRFNLILNGRKFNKEIESKVENSQLPSNIGFERLKHSRLNFKQVITFSLKNMKIPRQIEDRVFNSIMFYERAIYRLKFTVGNFYCYSQPLAIKEQIKLNDEEISIDINQLQYVQISLVFFKQDKSADKLMNQFINEEVLSSVSLRLKDFKQQSESQLVHELQFNNGIYNSQLKEDLDQTLVFLQTAIALSEVNGAESTAEQEGNQILIGKGILYKGIYPAKVIKIVNQTTCTLELFKPIPDQGEDQDLVIENVNIQKDVGLIERYGVSVLNLNDLPPKYENGLFEWTLKITFTQSDSEFLIKLQQAIVGYQIRQIFNWRFEGSKRQTKNKQFVCGDLQLGILDGQNLVNSKRELCNTYMVVSVRDTVNQMKSKYIDIANEESFVQCMKNSEQIIQKNFQTSVIPQSNNPTWVKKDCPNGEVFNLGMILASFPHFVLLEVYHKGKQGEQDELIGHVEFNTVDLISLDDLGKEFYLFLEDSISINSFIKVQTLFTPSKGTLKRLGLNPDQYIFKNAQQYLFYKVLHMEDIYDSFGYRVPIGEYNPRIEIIQRETMKDESSKQEDFTKRYENFSPSHKKQDDFKKDNPLRPKFEQNTYLFQKTWLYSQFQSRNTALTKRMSLLWEKYMTTLMRDLDENADMADDLKSMKSRWTNTTKMISSIHRKRARQAQSSTQSQIEMNNQRGQRFSVIFVGQWEKEQNWKYVDIWYLIKYGIPTELRLTIWCDLLRKQIHEGQDEKYFKNSYKYRNSYNRNISAYQNMKNFANERDSKFYLQIEEDVRNFKFPFKYQKSSELTRQDKIEEERLSIFQMLKVYEFWATEYSERKKKIIFYHKGSIAILQRLLTLMNEEEAFWIFIGLVKSFNRVWSFDFDPKLDQQGQDDQKFERYSLMYKGFSPFSDRKLCYRYEMYILKCTIKVQFPKVFQKLQALGVPFEWYFYEDFSQFYAYTFCSEIVLRLWDMVIFNLSTSQVSDRKRALWYLLSVPLYMVHLNQDLIVQAQTPEEVKSLLINRTASLNFNPDHFIEDLIKLIKQSFAKKHGLEYWMQGDKSQQLDSLRQEVEDNVLNMVLDEKAESLEIQKYEIRSGTELVLSQQFMFEPYPSHFIIKISLISFRNALSIQDAGQNTQIQVLFKGEENFQSPKIGLRVPQNVEDIQIQYLDQKIQVQTRMTKLEQNVIEVKVIQIKNGIHQVNLGEGTIDLANFITANQIENNISLKLQGNEYSQIAYIDLQINTVNAQGGRPQIQSFIEGTLKNDYDTFSASHDDQMRINYKGTYLQHQFQLIQGTQPKSIMLAHQLRHLTQLESLVSQYSQDFDKKEVIELLKKFSKQNLPMIIMQTNTVEELKSSFARIMTKVSFILSKADMNSLYDNLFRIFSYKQALNQNDLSRLIHHMYSITLHKIPYHQISTLISKSVNFSNQHSFIVKAMQKSIVSDQPETQSFFFFGGSTNEYVEFNVTEEFQDSLMRVIRTLGIINAIDMSLDPFNNIGFWLKSNKIKKQSQYLEVTLKDQNGDRLNYIFRFNAQGMLVPNNFNTLPIQVGGMKQIGKNDFTKIIESLPIINDCVRMNQFLYSQRNEEDNAITEVTQNYQVLFRTVNATFKIKFMDSVNKQNDFTIDDTQYNRIAKEDIGRVYSKSSQNGLLIEIKLSPIHIQDTCIMIKQRIKAVLDFIIMSENLKDVPSVLSERYQLKETDTGLIFNSLDRLCSQSQDINFELVRVNEHFDQEDYEFGNYGLYEHPDGSKEWRLCKVLQKKKLIRGKSDIFTVEYRHERRNYYQLSRENILLSLDYKKTQDDYYKEEVKEFLHRLESDAANVAAMLQNEDKKHFQQVSDFSNPSKAFGKPDEGLNIEDKHLAIEEDDNESEYGSEA